MPTSTRWSSGSAHCRIEWRPSSWLLAALALLSLAAPAAVIASGLPAWAAWPLAAVALAGGVRALPREARRPACVVGVRASPGGAAAMSIDGVVLADARIQWRGPLAFLSWRARDGRRRHLAWWPDTLPPAARRELRLAAPGSPTTGMRASMAP